jgi:sporulation protein YlmC with PRC-barrel domain
MSKVRDTVGLPVVTTSSADRIGKVDHFVVGDGRVEAIAVGEELVGWSDIRAVGEDAVVVESNQVLRGPENDYERRVLEGELTILGKLVLDDGGDELGLVADMEFDADDGAVRAVTVLDNRIAGERLRGIGGYAVVVAAEPA